MTLKKNPNKLVMQPISKFTNNKKNLIIHLLNYKMNYYAVAVGKEPGIYFSWNDCEQQVKGFKGAKFKKFNNEEDAQHFIASYSYYNEINKENIVQQDYYVYTDGACSKNGTKDAIAGIGIYFGKDDTRNVSKKIDLKPTNNVAELSAIIHACNLIESDSE